MKKPIGCVEPPVPFTPPLPAKGDADSKGRNRRIVKAASLADILGFNPKKPPTRNRFAGRDLNEQEEEKLLRLHPCSLTKADAEVRRQLMMSTPYLRLQAISGSLARERMEIDTEQRAALSDRICGESVMALGDSGDYS